MRFFRKHFYFRAEINFFDNILMLHQVHWLSRMHIAWPLVLTYHVRSGLKRRYDKSRPRNYRWCSSCGTICAKSSMLLSGPLWDTRRALLIIFVWIDFQTEYRNVQNWSECWRQAMFMSLHVGYCSNSVVEKLLFLLDCDVVIIKLC